MRDRIAIFPQLHDKSQLEELMDKFGSGSRIARYLGCSCTAVHQACRKFGIKKKGYFISEETKKKLMMK